MKQAYASVVIVAAGRGSRIGLPAKVMEVAGGQPLLAWSIEAAMAAPSVRDVIVVVGEHTEVDIRSLVAGRGWPRPIQVVTGGDRRQDSVAAGVAAVGRTSEVVLIHDGARPLASSDLFERCARAAMENGAVITATPVSDTLKRVESGTVAGTVSRDSLWGAQTPQGFRLDAITSAIERTRSMDTEFTDEASLFEALGEAVHIVPGERTNLKLTLHEDLEVIDALLTKRRRHLEG